MSVTEYTALKDWTIVNNLFKGMWKEGSLLILRYPSCQDSKREPHEYKSKALLL
jgi:hypothetical protein